MDELQRKHGNVSNEDFERELTEIAGIGYKQVKNYKNHPKPGHRLKDNAVVIKFVRERQRLDTGRKVRRAIVMGLFVIALVGGAYRALTAPRKIESFAIHEVPVPVSEPDRMVESKVFIEVPSTGWLLRLGPIKNTRIPMERFTCDKIVGMQQENCQFVGANLQVTIIKDGDLIKRYTILSTAADDAADIERQLLGKAGQPRQPATNAKEPIQSQSYKVGDETVNVMRTEKGPGTIDSISVTVAM
ncbi:MAG: hypothetical protein AB7F86_01315 [Bdellovibrionales bacterium]